MKVDAPPVAIIGPDAPTASMLSLPQAMGRRDKSTAMTHRELIFPPWYETLSRFHTIRAQSRG
jgi:hypothetical protein